MEPNENCPECNLRCVRNGKSKKGEQRLRCKKCNKNFQRSYLYHGRDPKVRKWIVQLVRESVGIRSIARILKISSATVIRHIKNAAKLSKRSFDVISGKEYEMDEIRTFVGSEKRQYWVAYAIERESRRVIDFKVGRRTAVTLKKVTDTLILARPKKIYTDGYSLYSNLLPSSIHCKSAYNINNIERLNLNLRTHLKRLSRKTICFSKSVAMLEACLRIYFWG